MLRLFVALSLPDLVQTRIAPMKTGLPGARWIDQENLHLTIRFIGEVEDTYAEDIHYSLSKLRFKAFPIRLKGIDTFRSRNMVRSVWAGIEPSTQLKALQKKIDTNLVSIGVAPETRKFTPHVTLARLKRAPLAKVFPYLVANAGFETQPFDVFQVFLFRSHLGSRGADYEALAAYPENI